MEIFEILLVLIALFCPWFLWHSIRDPMLEIRRINRCSVEATAEIQSWSAQEYSEESTQYTPTIRYSHNGHDYEAEFWKGAVTRYQKKHQLSADSMTIFVDPDDPASITPGNKSRAIFKEIESCVFVCGISLFFLGMGILIVYTWIH